MKFTEMLSQAQTQNNSMLCVGLDPEHSKMPSDLRHRKNAFFEFCAHIVDQTHDLAIAFKPQVAYFSAQRAEDQLEQLIKHIKQVAPQVPVILDAKRGDIGETAKQYAIEAFERYGADAVTLSPYMGYDSIEPYLAYQEKGLFLLCKTSNTGGSDLQNLSLDVRAQHPGTLHAPPLKLYEYVAQIANEKWNLNDQLGLVVGATYPQELSRVREIAPDMPLLIPGVGAQGGDAKATVLAAHNPQRPKHSARALINSSRAILYAGLLSGDTSSLEYNKNYAVFARQKALETKNLLNSFM
jgi:orotidine-5'-phosphate decarboxylase